MDCPRCKENENYGCGCTTLEMLYWYQDENARLCKIIKDASDLAEAGMMDEAAEMLHNEVYPPIKQNEAKA